MIKSKQISFKVTRAWDYLSTWKVVCIMHLYWNVFHNKYKYSILNGECYEIITKQNRKQKNKPFKKFYRVVFLIFHIKILYMTK